MSPRQPTLIPSAPAAPAPGSLEDARWRFAYGGRSQGPSNPISDRTVHVARFILNAPLTAPAYVWGEAAGDCTMRSGAVVVCTSMPAWANGPGDSLAVGAILTELDDLVGGHADHELVHPNQSAILGPGGYLAAAAAGLVVSAPLDLLKGCSLGTHSPLEIWAGPGGGYGC